jgi:CheY-like chemotaxis protein
MSPEPSAKRAIVLIVEDEPLQRMLAATVAEDAGFDVVEASSADEAIAILEARADIRIVFTDIDMPGSMSGLKLAEAIRNRWPPIELIITSGKFTASQIDLPARGKFFPKPYNPAVIAEALRGFQSNFQ